MDQSLTPGQRARTTYRAIQSIASRRLVLDRTAWLRDLVRGRSVLDIGCVDHSASNAPRHDWLHKHICEAAREVVGLDYEEAEIEKLRKMGYHAVAGDATAFELGRTFDVVVAGEVLEHLLNARGFLDSARKHLAEGGCLVLTVPNANSINYLIQNLLFGYETDGYDHVAFYTPLTLFNLLSKTGYRMTRLHYLMHDTSRHHPSPAVRAVVKLWRAIQMPFCLLRPSLCRQIAVVAEKAS